MTIPLKGAVVTSSLVTRPTKPRSYRDDLTELTVSVWDAARSLGIGRDACYTLIRDGRLKSIRIGTGKIRIPLTELEAFIARETK
jgi:excisionase family DNA binding protein